MPLVSVRRWVREAGVEARFMEALTSQEQEIYRSLVATSWVPVEVATKIYVQAAPLLFPKDAAPLRRIGRELARDNFRGVFRYLAQLSSVEGLVHKTAFLWRAFHDQGEAGSERVGERHLRFVVTGYPGLPERLRETICGWLAQAIELTGASNVSVTKSDEAEQRYFWAVTWRLLRAQEAEIPAKNWPPSILVSAVSAGANLGVGGVRHPVGSRFVAAVAPARARAGDRRTAASMSR